MRLTKREKIMLAILGALVVAFMIYSLIYKPQREQITDLRTKLKLDQINLQRLKVEISPENKVYKDHKILNTKIYSTTLRYFPEIKQDKIITIIDEMIKASKLQVDSISFMEEEEKLTEEDLVKALDQKTILQQLLDTYLGHRIDITPKETNPEEQQENNDLMGEVERITANLTFKGTYGNLMDFIHQVEGYDKKIIISTINTVRSEEGTLSGNINLDFYAVPKLHEQDVEYYEWELTDAYGKDNPFVPFAGFQQSSTAAKAESAVAAADFIMLVKPISADLPTIVLGRSKDKDNKTYIYADNSGFENVEIHFTEVDGKLYYKYKTPYESYPKNFEGEGVPFVPSSKGVGFEILSTPRNGKNDNSGVNLHIINNTSEMVHVTVRKDDKSLPRVKIVEKVGRVEVKK